MLQMPVIKKKKVDKKTLGVTVFKARQSERTLHLIMAMVVPGTTKKLKESFRK